MTSQLSQQNVSMAPNQPLIQFLSIPPQSEYEVKNKTFCIGLHPDRDQVLLAIRYRSENFQRHQHPKVGGRKDAGHAAVVDPGGRPGGKRYSASDARGRGNGRGGRCWGGTINQKDEEEEQHKADNADGDSVKCKCCYETYTNPPVALITSAVCVAVKVIRRRSAQLSSLFLRSREPRAAKTTVTSSLAAKRRKPLCVTRQASVDIIRIMRGVVERSLGKREISRSSAMVGYRATCFTHQPEWLTTTASRMLTWGWRAVRYTRSRVMATYHLSFDLGLVMYLCCFKL